LSYLLERKTNGTSHYRRQNKETDDPPFSTHTLFLPLIRHFPFKVIIGTSARHTINHTTIGTSISRRLVTNMADTPPGKAPRDINSPRIRPLDVFSTHLDRRFLLRGAGFRYIAAHLVLTTSGLALNRPIRSRISRKSLCGTATFHHLEYHAPGMPDHFGSDLDQLIKGFRRASLPH
jgi:hypothetical protein